jgi:hypothetical protein
MMLLKYIKTPLPFMDRPTRQVLRNVFPVEWGIFAFSSIIIVTTNIFQNALIKQNMLRGSNRRMNISATVAPFSLEPWRVEVVLLVEEAPRHYPTSARVQLKLGKRLRLLVGLIDKSP